MVILSGKSIWQNCIWRMLHLPRKAAASRIYVPRDFDGLVGTKVDIHVRGQEHFAGCQLSMHLVEPKSPNPAESWMKSNLGVDHESARIARGMIRAFFVFQNKVPLALTLDVITMRCGTSVWLANMNRMASNGKFCNVVALHELFCNYIEIALLHLAAFIICATVGARHHLQACWQSCFPLNPIKQKTNTKHNVFRSVKSLASMKVRSPSGNSSLIWRSPCS